MSHHQSEAFTIATLNVQQIRNLRALAENPSFELEPIQRKMFRRLGLIKPLDPPREPSDVQRRKVPRRHELTPLGYRTIGISVLADVAP